MKIEKKSSSRYIKSLPGKKICKAYMFGSVARGESNDIRDIDLLIEKDDNASAFGVKPFQYQVQQLLGIDIDAIPTFALPKVEHQVFVKSVQTKADAL
jgi:predicted nucleotidyltransferase